MNIISAESILNYLIAVVLQVKHNAKAKDTVTHMPLLHTELDIWKKSKMKMRFANISNEFVWSPYDSFQQTPSHKHTKNTDDIGCSRGHQS